MRGGGGGVVGDRVLLNTHGWVTIVQFTWEEEEEALCHIAMQGVGNKCSVRLHVADCLLIFRLSRLACAE